MNPLAFHLLRSLPLHLLIANPLVLRQRRSSLLHLISLNLSNLHGNPSPGYLHQQRTKFSPRTRAITNRALFRVALPTTTNLVALRGLVFLPRGTPSPRLMLSLQPHPATRQSLVALPPPFDLRQLRLPLNLRLLARITGVRVPCTLPSPHRPYQHLLQLRSTHQVSRHEVFSASNLASLKYHHLTEARS